MPGFTSNHYPGLLDQRSAVQERLFAAAADGQQDFDVIIIGSGMGGGILADDLAERLPQRSILVLEAGSYLFPTHVFNVCRFPNADVARRFAVDTFSQPGGGPGEFYLHEKPQLNFGGRSIFWSGLIPEVQEWELQFFPPHVRDGIRSRLALAGRMLNASTTMGGRAQQIVAALRRGPLAEHFIIEETPRALHQPYLNTAGQPQDEFWIESTGVFNTAELLINQLGLPTTGAGGNLRVRLNHFVESIERQADGRYRLVATDTHAGIERIVRGRIVILAAGSIESPKILRRSPVYQQLAPAVASLVGQGLTDHPTTDWIGGPVTGIGEVAIPRDCHAKIVCYSRGARQGDGAIRYPFNIEMNINHEYWHLRENDPSAPSSPITTNGASLLEMKFSFGNPLDENSSLEPPPAGNPYRPELRCRNLNWVDYLASERFVALAGWHKSRDDIFWDLNGLIHQVFSQFNEQGRAARPQPDCWLGQCNKGFGYGTVHHAVGTLRMPARRSHSEASFSAHAVVDENLMIAGQPNLFACDMSVMPFSSAANPVRTLAALALRLSEHLGGL